jgi:hypothetical protein
MMNERQIEARKTYHTRFAILKVGEQKLSYHMEDTACEPAPADRVPGYRLL